MFLDEVSDRSKRLIEGGEAMQRAPSFVFRNAREARDFRDWLVANFEAIKELAESTTSVGKLLDIEHYIFHNMVHTRFDYSTGDSAGQIADGAV